MNAPEMRRHEAINATVTGFLTASHELRTDVTRTEIVVTVDELVTMGRSNRWADAINAWANLLRDEGNDLRWALLQGSVFATHAA